MENVRIAVLSARDEPRAFMDNGAPEALHYYNDDLHEYVEGSAYTYFFTASAKHEDSKYLVEGNKIAFIYRDKPYYLNIMKVVKDEYTIDVEAYGLSLELLNEQTGEYSAASAMSFEQYIDAFDFADILTIGVNEVSDKKIKNEWTGDDTILSRLFSLANVFDAEIEFVTELNNDYSLARLVLNVYQSYDEESGTQGIGEDRRDITLRYGINVEGITKTSDITELYTAIRPTGKDGLTIASLNKTEYDADGNVAYKSPSGDINIYAVQACEQFPSNLLASTTDRYICEVWSYDTDNVNTLYGQALARLKAQCVPKVTYKIDGYFDTDIGDTVQVDDEEYNPPLYLDARVTEQVRSFTDPTRNKTTFSNVVEKESQIDPELIARMQQLIQENKVYACDIVSTNGIVFKNSEGSTTLTAVIRDGGSDITEDFSFTWYKDGSHLSSNKTITISADDVNGKSVYRTEARDLNGVLRASAEVTVINVSDGQDITGWADQFYLSTSQTSLSGGAWSYVQPEWETGKYYWTRSEITWSDGRTTYTEPILATGLNNANQTAYEAKQEAETMQTVINEISQSVDKKAEIWYQYEDPSLDWTGTEEVALVDHEGNTIVDHEGNTIVALWEKEKAAHEGDIWKDRNDNSEYIYQDGQWVPMPVPDEIFDEIDGKSQIFVIQPYPPYDVGDLWFTGTEILVSEAKRDEGDFVATDWVKKENYTDDSALNEFLAGEYAQTIEDLKAQSDKKAETWYQAEDPAFGWTSTEKAQHKGDLWYNTSEQKTCIYDGSQWEETKTEPPDEVFDQIDGKAQIFVSQPTPPYQVGDLWFNSSTSDIMTCIAARESGSYTASDWEKRNKYTDDSYAQQISQEFNTFLGEYQSEIEGIQNSIDKKAETWYQATDPSLSWTGTEECALVDHAGNTIIDHEGNTIVALWEKEKAMHEGDLWYDTNSGNQYIYQSGHWEPMEIPKDVFDTIDGKAQIFVSQPVPPYDVGDLWAQGANGDIMRCKTARQSGSYVSTDWEKASKYTDDTAVDNLDSELDQQGVFDRLTNNGQAQGIWKENSELYINGAYVEFLGATIGGWEVSTESLMSPSGTIVLDAAEAAIYTQNNNGNKGAIFHDEGIDFYSWYEDGRHIGQLADYIHTLYGEEMLMLDALIPLCLHNKIFLSDSPSEQGAFVEGVTVRDDVQLVGDLYIGFPSQSGKSGAKVSYDDSQKTLALDAEHIDINGAVTSNQNNIVLGGTHKIKLNWNGSGLELYVDEIYIGYVQTAK